MTNRAVVPLNEMQRRLPEAGRIRLGVQTERAMKAIEHFRFTSPDEEAIKQLASLYGGVCRPWNNTRANPQSQFEVLSKAAEIRVFLPPDALSVYYEQWTGGGCAKRCDGITCEIAKGDGIQEIACPCAVPRPPKFPDGMMECKPYTRLTVVLPDIRFGGGWRLETKGWNAAHEMPGMVQMIHEVQGRGLTEARLRLDKESTMKAGKRSHFVVPRLLIPETPMAMIEGAGQVGSLGTGDRLALPAATTPEEREASEPLQVTPTSQAPAGEWFDADEDIVDAEIVEDGVGRVVDAFPGATVEDAPPPAEERSAPREQTRETIQGERQVRRSANPALTKLVLDCKTLGAQLVTATLIEEGTEPLGEELRHAVAWWASKGATQSSSALSPDALSKAIDAILRCEENLKWAAQLLTKFRERPL